MIPKLPPVPLTTALRITALAILLICHPRAHRVLQAQGNVIYVNVNATGANNGSSWANAFTTLRDALAVAQDDDQIWVARGVYYPDEGSGATNNNKNSTFVLSGEIALYGGFAGGETALAQRNVAVNLTVLSGDLEQNDTTDSNGIVRLAGNVGDNALHVVTASNAPTAARLDGFVLTGGVALDHDTNCPEGCGGGLYAQSGSPILANVTIAGNRASYGAGIFFLSASTPTLDHVTFRHNKSNHFGGGLHAQQEANVTLTHVQFISNTANSYGGGAFVSDITATWEDVTFTDNLAESTTEGNGGGLANYTDANVTLNHVTFTNNHAGYSGGAIYNHPEVSPVIFDAHFSGNRAQVGGAIYNSEKSSPQILTAAFIKNYALTGGAILAYGLSRMTLQAVEFSGNLAKTYGGALFLQNSSPILINVVFGGNRAEIGGALYNLHGSPSLTNVTFNGNQVMQNEGGSAIFNDHGSNLLLQNSVVWDNYNSLNGTATIRYSVLEGGLPPGVTDGGHNLAANPLFVREATCGTDLCGNDPTTAADESANDDYGDLQLRGASPAIDVGDNGVVNNHVDVGEIDYDLNGQPRIVPIRSLPATVDLGAYERRNGPPLAAAGGPYEVQEGSPLALNGAGSSDDDGGIATYAWDCTNNGNNEATSPSPTGSACTYADDGLFTVKLTVTDTWGLFNFATTTVTVANVAPILTAALNQSTFALTNKTFNLGTFTDPGADAPWQVTVDWGDETDTEFNIPNTGNISSAHTYAAPSSYSVIVTVHDGKDSANGGFQATINPASVGIVEGIVFHDVNNNGQQEENEVGIEDVQVTLTDEASAAGVALQRTTTSADDGSYTFDGVPPNQYTLIITLPSGYMHVGSAQHIVTITAGSTTTAPSFRLRADAPASDALFLPAVERP